LGGVSSDAAPAPSFSPLFGKTLSRQPLTCPASAQTTIWCKKRASASKLVTGSIDNIARELIIRVKLGADIFRS